MNHSTKTASVTALRDQIPPLDYKTYGKRSPHREMAELALSSPDLYEMTDAPSKQRAIFLCFTNRSGSTLVASTLAARGIFGPPNEFMNYEYFNGDAIVAACLKYKLKSLGAYIEYIFDNHRSPLGFFASKISADQLCWLTDIGLIHGRFEAPLFIFVRRHNILRQSISLSIARQTGQWTSLHSEKPSRFLTFDPQTLFADACSLRDENTLFDQYFSSVNIKPIQIYYENFSDELNGIVAEVGASLRLSPHTEDRYTDNTIALERQSGQLNDMIETYFLEYCRHRDLVI